MSLATSTQLHHPTTTPSAAPTTTSNSPANNAYAQRIEELGRIIMAYSEVTERLQQSHDQLSGQVRSLRDELSEKNRLLERKNRLAAVGEMAAGMAHEIRNPLGGIQLYASLLVNDLDDRPESCELVKKISAGVKRLEKLVSQVLNFSREINISRCETDLAELVAQAVELSQSQAASKQVRVNVYGPNAMIVSVDPMLLGQALLNLLLNAIDAMQSPGAIDVRFAPAGEASDARQFHLSVRDRGPGIDPKIIDRIFNPFFTTKDTGTGLGLSIVHRIVEAHDGSITASSVVDDGGGGGAKFEIRV